jgi:hypothetical protein
MITRVNNKPSPLYTNHFNSENKIVKHTTHTAPTLFKLSSPINVKANLYYAISLAIAFCKLGIHGQLLFNIAEFMSVLCCLYNSIGSDSVCTAKSC